MIADANSGASVQKAAENPTGVDSGGSSEGPSEPREPAPVSVRMLAKLFSGTPTGDQNDSHESIKRLSQERAAQQTAPLNKENSSSFETAAYFSDQEVLRSFTSRNDSISKSESGSAQNVDLASNSKVILEPAPAEAVIGVDHSNTTPKGSCDIPEHTPASVSRLVQLFSGNHVADQGDNRDSVKHLSRESSRQSETVPGHEGNSVAFETAAYSSNQEVQRTSSSRGVSTSRSGSGSGQDEDVDSESVPVVAGIVPYAGVASDTEKLAGVHHDGDTSKDSSAASHAAPAVVGLLTRMLSWRRSADRDGNWESVDSAAQQNNAGQDIGDANDTAKFVDIDHDEHASESLSQTPEPAPARVGLLTRVLSWTRSSDQDENRESVGSVTHQDDVNQDTADASDIERVAGVNHDSGASIDSSQASEPAAMPVGLMTRMLSWRRSAHRDENRESVEQSFWESTPRANLTEDGRTFCGPRRAMYHDGTRTWFFLKVWVARCAGR